MSIHGDHLPEMIFTSSYFHSYLKLVLEDIHLSPKLKFGLSYKGTTFVLKVEYIITYTYATFRNLTSSLPYRYRLYV